MNRIRDIVYQNDINKLPKAELSDICLEMKIDHKGLAPVLAKRIWTELEEKRGRLDTLEKVENRLLAGKVSVTWFIAKNSFSLKTLKENILKKNDFDPFEKAKTPKSDDVGEDPILIAATMGKTDGECYLRYLQKVGSQQYLDGTSQVSIPTMGITTIYINEALNLIELRGDAKYSLKALSSFINSLEEDLGIERVEIFKNFNSNIEEIAELLAGELIETTSRPDFLLRDLTSEHKKAVIRILEALNHFFDNSGEEELIEILKKEKENLGDLILTTIPFTALILGGIESVGLRAKDRNLKQQSLYGYLKPYMTHHGGLLKFERSAGGTKKEFTIQIGATTESIFFRTSATEDVISFVRERIIKAILDKNKKTT